MKAALSSADGLRNNAKAKEMCNEGMQVPSCLQQGCRYTPSSGSRVGRVSSSQRAARAIVGRPRTEDTARTGQSSRNGNRPQTMWPSSSFALWVAAAPYQAWPCQACQARQPMRPNFDDATAAGRRRGTLPTMVVRVAPQRGFGPLTHRGNAVFLGCLVGDCWDLDVARVAAPRMSLPDRDLA